MRNALKAFNGAVSLLTTVPTPAYYPDEPGRAYAFFPLVGVLMGLALWGAITLLQLFFPADVAAFGGLALWVLITGGLHMDGFGDSCDGLFAAVEPARRLEIMKDPRTGTWAVLGLILLLLGKWNALRFAPLVALPLVTGVARWVMVLAAGNFPYARQTGMSAYFSSGLGRVQLLTATLTALVLVAVYVRYAVALAVVLIAVSIVAGWASRRLGGGLTGDVYGALCELTELLLLLAISTPD
ncbi:MAG: adenosylcobinamide-GDP ribazoletransferase [Chloroflexota bacterium]